MAVDKVKKLSKRDLTELTDASEAAIRDGSGFGWVEVPPRAVLERYWRGVLVVPTRSLFLARFESVVCGSVQLVEPPKNKEVWSFAATIDTHFVAPIPNLGAGRVDPGSASGLEVLDLDQTHGRKSFFARVRNHDRDDVVPRCEPLQDVGGIAQ